MLPRRLPQHVDRHSIEVLRKESRSCPLASLNICPSHVGIEQSVKGITVLQQHEVGATVEGIARQAELEVYKCDNFWSWVGQPAWVHCICPKAVFDRSRAKFRKIHRQQRTEKEVSQTKTRVHVSTFLGVSATFHLFLWRVFWIECKQRCGFLKCLTKISWMY